MTNREAPPLQQLYVICFRELIAWQFPFGDSLLFSDELLNSDGLVERSVEFNVCFRNSTVGLGDMFFEFCLALLKEH